MKRLLTAVGILAVVVVAAYSQRATIAAKQMEKGLESRMSAAGLQAMPFTMPANSDEIRLIREGL